MAAFFCGHTNARLFFTAARSIFVIIYESNENRFRRWNRKEAVSESGFYPPMRMRLFQWKVLGGASRESFFYWAFRFPKCKL
jgi:hypothetical protein